MKYDFYRMVIENPKTGEIKSYVSKKQGAAPAGWICKGVVGGWQTPKKEERRK